GILRVSITLSIVLIWVVPSRGDEAKDIVQKAVKALGDDAKAAKLKAATWKSKGKFYGMGEGIPFTGDYAVWWPDRIRLIAEMEFGGQAVKFVRVYNQGKSWMKIN